MNWAIMLSLDSKSTIFLVMKLDEGKYMLFSHMIKIISWKVEWFICIVDVTREHSKSKFYGSYSPINRKAMKCKFFAPSLFMLLSLSSFFKFST